MRFQRSGRRFAVATLALVMALAGAIASEAAAWVAGEGGHAHASSIGSSPSIARTVPRSQATQNVAITRGPLLVRTPLAGWETSVSPAPAMTRRERLSRLTILRI